VCQHGATVHARRLDAVVAGGGDVLDDRQGGGAADQQADVAPSLFLVEPVETMAGRHARLAATARIEVHLEGVLLTGAGRGARDQVAVYAGGARPRAVPPRLVDAGEPLDGGGLPLPLEQQ